MNSTEKLKLSKKVMKKPSQTKKSPLICLKNKKQKHLQLKEIAAEQ
jgi:hypothetical protein